MPKIPTNQLPPALRDEDGRTRFATRLYSEILMSINDMGDLPQRFDESEKLFRNQSEVPRGVDVKNGYPYITIPVVQPKIKKIIGTVMGAITHMTPYVQAVTVQDDEGAAKAVTMDLHELAYRGGFDSNLYTTTKTGLLTNIGIWRVIVEEVDPAFLPSVVGNALPLTEKGATFAIDTIHPTDFIAYPAMQKTVERMRMVGHRFNRRAYEVQAMSNAGIYYPEGDFVVGGASIRDEYPEGRDREFDGTNASTTLELKDRDVEEFELYRKENFGDWGWDPTGPEEWYRIVIAASPNRRCLSIEKWGMPVPPYFDVRFDLEGGSFWPSGSVAQDLKGCQQAESDLFHLAINGAAAKAFAPIVIPQGSMPKKKMEVSLASFLELNLGDFKLQTLPIGVDIGTIEPLLEFLESKADAAAQISQNGQGQEMKSGTSATEVQALAQTEQQAESHYISMVGMTLEKMYNYMSLLYAKHFDALHRSHGEFLKANIEQAKQSFKFEVNGKSIGNTAQGLQTKLGMAKGIAAEPGSEYDMRKLDDASMQALQLPFSTESLKFDGDQWFQSAMQDPQRGPIIKKALEAAMKMGQQEVAQHVQEGINAGQGTGMEGVLGEPGNGPPPGPPSGAPGIPGQAVNQGTGYPEAVPVAGGIS